MDFEQLRQLHLTKHGMDSERFDSSAGILAFRHLRLVKNESSLIFLLSFLSVLGIFVLGKSGTSRLERHLREKRLLVFRNYRGSAFTSTTVLGIALVTANAVLSLMQCVVDQEASNKERERRGLLDNSSVNCHARIPIFVVFLLEIASLASVWLAVWRKSLDQYSVLSVMLYFLPTFYDFVGILDGSISYSVASIKLLIFFHSLLFSVAFWFPYLYREIENARKIVEGNAAGVLSKRREELAELKRIHGRNGKVHR